MKGLNLFFIALFLLSAVLQYNDPDPYIWIPVYLYGAFICYRAFRGKFDRKAIMAGWIVYGLYALYLFFGSEGVISWWQEHDAENIAQSMKATKPWIEGTREFFGLLILLLALTINWTWLRKKDSQRSRQIHRG